MYCKDCYKKINQSDAKNRMKRYRNKDVTFQKNPNSWLKIKVCWHFSVCIYTVMDNKEIPYISR